jgi:hypothetical protein
LAQPVTSERRQASISGNTLFAIQKVQVVDSVGFPKGATIKIVAPVPYYSPNHMPALSPDSTYLVIAEKVHNGKLEIPRINLTGELFPAAAPDEISGLAVFETKQSKLADGPNLSNRVANSVADCLDGTSDAGVADVLTFFHNAMYPGYEPRKMVFGQPDFPLSIRLRNLAEKAGPYQRAQILLAVNYFRVFGSADAYLDAVIECASDLRAYSGPNATVQEPYFYENGRERNLPKGFRHTAPSPNRWVEIVTSAKNPRVRLYLLRGTNGVPDEAHQRKLSSLLYDSDPNVRRLVAEHYAWSYKDATHAPKMIKLTNGQKIYPNLDQAVEFWRDKFAGARPPRN